MISSTYTHKQKGIHSFIRSFIHSVVRITQVHSPFKASSPHSAIYCFILQFTVASPLLKASSSYLCLPPRPPATSIHPSIFPSITCYRRQFLRTIWPTQLAVVLFTVRRIFLSSLTLCKVLHFSHDLSNGLLQPSTAPHFKSFKLFLIYFLRGSVIFFSVYTHKQRNTRVHC